MWPEDGRGCRAGAGCCGKSASGPDGGCGHDLLRLAGYGSAYRRSILRHEKSFS